MCFPSGALPTSRPKPVHEGSRDPAPLGIPGGVLVLANDGAAATDDLRRVRTTFVGKAGLFLDQANISPT
jgi:hypothetical protein